MQQVWIKLIKSDKEMHVNSFAVLNFLLIIKYEKYIYKKKTLTISNNTKFLEQSVY